MELYTLKRGQQTRTLPREMAIKEAKELSANSGGVILESPDGIVKMSYRDGQLDTYSFDTKKLFGR